MPYKDPEKQKAAKRASANRARQRAGAAANGQAFVEREAGVERVLPAPPGKDELLKLLGVQARLGSVRAIDLLLKREDGLVGNDAADPLSEVDELAMRRAIGA